MTPHERVIAALELREPDRVPTFDMMYELSNIAEILGKRPDPYGFVFTNKYASKAFDFAAAHLDLSRMVEKGMDDFAYDNTAAAVNLGYDSAWIIHTPTWIYQSAKKIHDIYGRAWDVLVDSQGNLQSPMYSGGLIKSASDWEAWDRSRVFRMPELTRRIYSKIQRDFGDRIFIFGCFHGGLFELSWQSMGFEEFVRATRRERDHVQRVIRFLTDLYCMMLEAMADAGLPGVIYPDDLAYRSGPMLSPKMLEELYGDSFRRITSTAHLYGMKVVVHTCGNVYSLLDWLADCGFDGIHGLEPTAGVELAKAKEMIGDRMCLVGNIDVTHVLVDAGREEVFDAVRRAIEDAGAGGGYIVANTNTHPDIKVRNLRWMLEAVEEYGRY